MFLIMCCEGIVQLRDVYSIFLSFTTGKDWRINSSSGVNKPLCQA